MTRQFVQQTGLDWQRSLWTYANASPFLSGGVRTLARRLQAALMLPHRVSRFLARRDVRPTHLPVSHYHLHHPKAIGAAKTRLNTIFLCLIHDLILIEFEEYNRPNEAAKHRLRIEMATPFADVFVVNSISTRDALLQFMRNTRREVPLIVAPLRSHTARRTVSAEPVSEPPYFLYFGTIESRKNHLLLFQVWRLLALERGEQCPCFVMVGQRGWKNAMVLEVIKPFAILRDCIVEYNALLDERFRELVSDARALLLPSFAECYKLAVAGAPLAGASVVCSDLPALREMGGDRPEYLDPLDALSWLTAIRDYASERLVHHAGQLARFAHRSPPSWHAHLDAVLYLSDDVAGAAT